MGGSAKTGRGTGKREQRKCHAATRMSCKGLSLNMRHIQLLAWWHLQEQLYLPPTAKPFLETLGIRMNRSQNNDEGERE